MKTLDIKQAFRDEGPRAQVSPVEIGERPTLVGDKCGLTVRKEAAHSMTYAGHDL